VSITKWFGAVTVLLLVAVIGSYVAVRSTLEPFDDAARALAPGKFVQLTDGKVHYAWHPARGDEPAAQVTVLVHGFSTPSYVWAGLLAPLTEANHRVLVYDNFGRGFSDRPHADNNAELFDRQLLELLESQNIKESVNVVGYSMGGAIATYFTARHPEKVRRLGLIAPAGFPVNSGAVETWLSVPVLGDWLMAVFGRGILREIMSTPENQGRAVADIVKKYEVQMRFEGYLRSLLSTIRNFPMGEMEKEYQRVGKANVPVLAIWGDGDAVVPPTNADLIAKVTPQAKFVSIEGGTHAITYSEPKKVSAALIDFLGTPSAHTHSRASQ
jgi:pimeloyl-ACP methyl ester carboxylesterase